MLASKDKYVCKAPTVPVKDYISKDVLSSDGNSKIAELQIIALLEDIQCKVLLDSGSDANLISLQKLKQLNIEFDQLEDAHGPIAAVLAGNTEMDLIACKWIKVQLGEITMKIPFSVIKCGTETILGIGSLKYFSVSLEFSNKGVCIKSLDTKLMSILSLNLVCFSYNENKITLYPRQNKAYFVENVNLIENETYSIHVQKGPPVAIPGLAKAKNNRIFVLLRNDTKNKIVIKPKNIIFCIEQFHLENECLIDENEYDENEWKNTSKFSTNYSVNVNSVFYCNVNTADLEKTSFAGEHREASDFETLSEMQGISIPEVNIPSLDIRQVVHDSFSNCNETEKDYLIAKFLQYPNIVSRHTLDTGILKDYRGQELLVDVELKKPVPRNSRFYSLSEDEEIQLIEILSYLEHYGIIEKAPPHLEFGVPVFLISRGNNPQKPCRLLLDTRSLADVVSDGLSTPSTDVHSYISSILKSDIASLVDCSNAYYSLKFHQNTLETGLTQFKTRFGCYRMLRLGMGYNFSCRKFNDTIGTQMALNDEGEVDKMHNFWNYFDDLGAHNTGNVAMHMELLDIFFYRLNRLGIKINVSKSQFFVKIKKEKFNLLGFEINNGCLNPQANKLDTIKKFKPPSSRTELQKFMGLITFLRPTLPPLVLHLSTVLYQLTSPTVEFKWEEQHTLAFKEIKNIIGTGLNYVHPYQNSILIIYTDSSESLIGSLAFAYDISSEPGLFERNLVNISALNIANSSFSEHVAGYNMNLELIDDKLQPMAEYLRVFYLVYIYLKDFNVHVQLPKEKTIVNNVLSTIFCNLHNVQTIFNNQVDAFISVILNTRLDDKLFFEYLQQILYLVCLLIKVNIKIIIGSNKKHKGPGIVICNLYKTDILLGYCTVKNKFYLLKANEDFEFGTFFLRASKYVDLCRVAPEVILKVFLERMAEKTENKCIRLVGLYSKSIEQVDMHQPIYIKESLGILRALAHFKNYIKSAPLCLLLTDSKVATFLFSQKMAHSKKRIYHYGLKIAIEFPNVLLYHISGKSNASDVLTRLGLEKKDFFSKTLTPIRVKPEFRKLLNGKITSFVDLYHFIDAHPDAIEFSDKKLSLEDKNNFYLDLEQHANVNLLKITYKYPYEKIDIMEEFLSRENIIRLQQLESGLEVFHRRNGMYVFDDKIILPIKLYPVLIGKEHFITLHGGRKIILNNILMQFHITDLRYLKELIGNMSDACLGCTLITSNKDVFKHGIFPLKHKNYCIQIDFVENLPSLNKYLFVIVDLYTKFISVYVHPNKSFKYVINSLINYYSVHGPVKTISSDNYFRSAKMKKFCENHGTLLLESAAFKSRARGMVENANLRIQRAIKLVQIYCTLPWEYNLAFVVYALNNKRFNSSEITPSALHLGFNGNNVLDMEQKNKLLIGSGINLKPNDISKVYDDFKRAEIELISQLENERKKIQSKINIKRKNHTFKINDLVLIKRRSVAIGKKVKGMSIDQLSGAIDGDIAEFCSLFQILTEDNVHEEFEQLLIGPKEKTGVRTRKQLEMELAESRMDPLKLLLEEDDYIDFQD